MSRNNRNNPPAQPQAPEAAGKAEQDAPLQAPEAAEAEAKAKADKEAAEAEAVKPHHEIAKGVSLTSKRGILAPGATVVAADLAGGEEAFKQLIEAKKIVYVK